MKAVLVEDFGERNFRGIWMYSERGSRGVIR